MDRSTLSLNKEAGKLPRFKLTLKKLPKNDHP